MPKFAILGGTRILDYRWLLDRCDEVITWPCSAEELSYRFHRVLGHNADPAPGNILEPELRKQFVKLSLIGESLPFIRSLSLIHQVARYNAPVLLHAETGTGKELSARAIHYLGPRAAEPFIPVNCGALPEQIFENEIFGHEQGAFTDAKKNQQGLVGLAHGGTLFLDEVDALSLKSQIVLLRFLQDHQYKPLGAQKYEHADVRVIAATSANLERLVEKKQFREDLFFRLNIIQITMPPLRERTEDIPLLANYFIKRFRSQYGGAERTLCMDSLAWMRHYRWPGNIRELENVVHKAFMLSGEEPALRLQPPVQFIVNRQRVAFSGMNWDVKFAEAKNFLIDVFEKRYLVYVLSKANGNVSRAAKLAGKERRSLGKLIKKHGLNKHNELAATRAA
ncbi:MAG: sigma-54-dependent Fis family transcriptional regulator [Desulfatitalea sp.]|nr:sigma-54-dependent Fis family transcriptional regulator [Desulfatitalea sp.]